MAAGQRVVAIDYKPRNWAKPFHGSLRRWAALVLHRRAGKTTALIHHHQRAAMDDAWEAKRLRALMPELSDAHLKSLLKNRHYGHVMPTYKQAKLVAWEMLKAAAAGVDGVKVNEVDLQVTYRNGNWIRLFGADSPDSLRGPAFSGLSFDEYSQHPPNIFGEVLSKALADHLGYAIFAGTIVGKNQLYRAHEAGKTDPEWFCLWQDVDRSVATENDAATLMIKRAMEDDRSLIAKGLMTQEEFDQEWYLSTEAAVKGSYYSKQLMEARKAGRITRVPYDPLLPVDTYWDLGVSDQMTIWFTQSLKTGEVRLIDYYAHSGEGFEHYAKVLKQEKSYVYGKHWAPHDIEVREMGTGKSRLEAAKAHGIAFQTVPKLGLADGIGAARAIFPRCWFDEAHCHDGIEALTHYQKTWNERLKEFTETPFHNWASHGADAFRYLAVAHQPPKDQKPADPEARLCRYNDRLSWLR